MSIDPLSDIVPVLDDLETTFRSELAMLEEAQRRLKTATEAADDVARAEGMVDVRRALRMLRKTNAEVRSFVEAALERAGCGDGPGTIAANRLRSLRFPRTGPP